MKKEVEVKEESGSVHWSRQKEKAAGYWHIKLLLILFKIFPVVILRILAFPVGFFYFLFSKNARDESARFLRKAADSIADPVLAKKCRSRFGPLRHIISFSLTLVEKIESWGGKFRFDRVDFQDDDIAELTGGLEKGRGAFLISSHLGNMELLRGLADFGRTGVSRKVPVTPILDVAVSAHFTRMLKELNPHSDMNIINAAEIGPHTAVLLEEKLAAGELVVIAGDRTAAGSAGGNLLFPFLGEQAPFSPGVFHLASLLNAPVYFIFGLRRDDLSIRPRYRMHIRKSPLTFDCPRKERIRRSVLLAESFAGMLERYCKEKPFQWYNFFDFWSKEVKQ